MGTEEELVYSIIETVQKGNLSDDAKVDERVVRAFVRTYRAAAIAKYSMNGHLISDECFQSLGEITFTNMAPYQFQADMPKMIRLQDNFGVILGKSGESIPVMNSEAYSLGMKSLINGNLPKAMLFNNRLRVYIGKLTVSSCGGTFPGLNIVVENFKKDLDAYGNVIKAYVNAVLYDCDDSPGYDWTTDPYPCPAELIQEIKLKVLEKEYGIVLNLSPDRVTDGNDQSQQQPKQQ